MQLDQFIHSLEEFLARNPTAEVTLNDDAGYFREITRVELIRSSMYPKVIVHT